MIRSLFRNYYLIFFLSHPKYRLVLKEKCPMCVFGSTDEKKPTENQSQGTTADAEAA